MWFRKKQETVPAIVDSNTVWSTLQSLQMPEKNRQAIYVLEDKLQHMRWSLILSVVLLGSSLTLALGMTSWNMYQLNQLQQQVTTTR